MKKLAVLILLASSLQGAITLLTTRSVGIPAGAATTSSVDTTGASLCVASFSDGANTATYAPTDSKGNTWHGLTVNTPIAGQAQVQLWYTWDHGGTPLSVGTGHTFTGTVTGSGFPFAVFTCYGGTQTSSDPFDVQNTGGTGASTGTSTQPGSVTPGAINELLVTTVSGYVETSGFSINSGFTISSQSPLVGGTNFAGAQAYLVETSIVAQNPTWTLSSGIPQVMGASIATFKAVIASTSSIKHKSIQGQ